MHEISKLQRQLGIELLEIQGQKAELTGAGLRRAQRLLKEAEALE
ncbi:hypothetical protein [Endozoicomonas sp. YOMI1]|nr:hypothetical protein [Endozoicomonas sp. YOMI1]